MPFNGNGVYAAPALPGSFNPATTGSSATPADWNTLLADISTALSTTITRDGQTTVTADIPMATHKFTGLGNGSATTDSVALGQVWSVFSAQPVTGVSIIDFTSIPSTVNNIQCEYDLKLSSNGATIGLQAYDANGVLDTGANYYWNCLNFNTNDASSVTHNAPTTLISITGTGIDNSVAGVGGDLIVTNVQSATRYKKFNFRNNFQSGGFGFGTAGYGAYFALNKITGFRMTVSAGTFDGYATLLVC